MLAIRLPADVESRLDLLARKTGRSKSFYAREAILEHLDDMEDLYLAEQQMTDIRAGQLTAQRILSFLHGRLAVLEDPRSLGEALKGSELGEFWKYRVGDYRIISSIEDKTVTIYVVRIGNRRDVYRKP